MKSLLLFLNFMNIPWYVGPVVNQLRFCQDSTTIRRAQVPVICVPSYSAINRSELALATRKNMDAALFFHGLAEVKPLIVFGSCSHAFPNAHVYEERMKVDICRARQAEYISVGPITNSINEMWAWRDVLRARNRLPDKLLITTCELHSKAEMLLAGMVFRGVTVYMRASDYRYEVEFDHPTDDQASWRKWTSCSLQRYSAFKVASLLPTDRQQWFLRRLAKRQHAQGKIKRSEKSVPVA